MPTARTDTPRKPAPVAHPHGRPRPGLWHWTRHGLGAGALALLIAPWSAATTPSDGERGRSVFVKHCAVCHGEQGDGRSRAQFSLNPPPRDFTAPRARTELSAERMVAAVTEGRPTTAMASFKSRLDAAEIQAVVAYIRSTFMGLPAPATLARAAIAGAPMTAPMPSGLHGDAALGARFYRANCATCHGAQGDGQGPRAYFIQPRPRNFLHPSARLTLSRPALYAMISEGVRGTEMPAWKQVLSPQELANVAEFVFQQFIQGGGAAQAVGR